MEKLSSIGKLEWLRNKILSRKKEGTIEVHVCMTGCRAYGAAAVNPCHRLSRFLRQGAGDCH
jgi:NADH-quinone oxidoreductase subunit F